MKQFEWDVHTQQLKLVNSCIYYTSYSWDWFIH